MPFGLDVHASVRQQGRSPSQPLKIISGKEAPLALNHLKRHLKLITETVKGNRAAHAAASFPFPISRNGDACRSGGFALGEAKGFPGYAQPSGEFLGEGRLVVEGWSYSFGNIGASRRCV